MNPDKITLKRIKYLHPYLQLDAYLIYQDLYNRGIKIRYTSTYRSFNEQNTLYAQGRMNLKELNILRKKNNLYQLSEKENRVVTNAKGGQSWHNYRLALDFCLLDRHNAYNMNYDINNDNEKDWMQVVEIFKSYNWEWGSEVNFRGDTPHFQKTFGHSIVDIRKKYENNEFLEYVKL